jgi:hypothetical protein
MNAKVGVLTVNGMVEVMVDPDPARFSFPDFIANSRRDGYVLIWSIDGAAIYVPGDKVIALVYGKEDQTSRVSVGTGSAPRIN